MEIRGQFTFYESFRSALKRIKKGADRAAAYDAICDYALYGIEPDLDKLPDAAAIAFISARPNLDASRAKAKNGKQGGSKTNSASENGECKPEANGKQTGSKPEANGKQNEAKPKQEKTASEKENEKENEGEKEKENECYSACAPEEANHKQSEADVVASYNFAPALLIAVEDWLAYKREKRQSYKPTGLKTMLNQITKAADEYGDAAVVEVIHNSMASGYQGIVFDRLTRTKKTSNQGRLDWLKDVKLT